MQDHEQRRPVDWAKVDRAPDMDVTPAPSAYRADEQVNDEIESEIEAAE